MKKFLVLILAISMAFCASAFASLPVGTELTPTPEDYANTDLSKAETMYLYLVGDTYPDFEEILANINTELAKFNTTLDVTMLSWSDASTMYPLVLAGGDQVDIIFTATWRSLWTEAANESFFVLDEDFINAYMPYTAQYQPKESFDQVTYAGKIQAVTQNKTPASPTILGIRTDLADQFGLSTDISTWEDLEAYMLGIAEHTDENGVFAWNAGNTDYGMATEYNRQFGLMGTAINWIFAYADGETPTTDDIQFYWTSEWFHNWISKAKMLADAGCWSRSALSKTENAAQSFQNGTGASITWNFTIYQYMTYLETQVLGVEKGTATKDILLYPEVLTVAEGYNNNALSIASASSDPQRAAMVIDILKFNTDINTMICLGIEGRHYIDLGDGFYENGPDYANYTPAGMSWGWATQNDNWRTKYDRDDANEMYDFIMANLANNPTIAFSFDSEPVSAYASAVESAINEYRYTLYLGLVDDADAAFDDFCSILDQSGLENYNAEFESQYQAWYDMLDL